MPELDPEITYRLCTPVSLEPGMQLLMPNAVKGACSQCPNPVWIDASQEMPDFLIAPPVPLCLRCAWSHPEMRRDMLKGLPAMALDYLVLGITSVYKDGEQYLGPPEQEGPESAGDSLRDPVAGEE